MRESLRGSVNSPDVFSPITVNTLIAKGSDNRPFAVIKVKDKQIDCLLDSGANSSIAGPGGQKLLESMGFPIERKEQIYVYTAAAEEHAIIGIIRAPCEFRGRIKFINFYVCPSLDHDFILGVDFWTAFEVRVQNKQGKWYCDSLQLAAEETKVFGLVSYEHLSEEQKHVAQNAMDQFKLLANSERLGRTSVLIQDVDTGDAQPTVQRYFPVSPGVQARMSAELDRMIALDVVEPSRSPWRSPVTIVKKANGKDRLCLDCRKVNSVTKFDAYPIPYISSILDNLGTTKYLTSIDLKDAFWQIPLTESAREKTAFVVPKRGLWQMKVVPFGMKNSAQAMQRLVDRLFGGEMGIFTYLDDIIIVTETFEEHLRLLELVRQRLMEANLTVNPEKCKFFRASLKYLGFIIDSRGLHTDPGKVKAIAEYPKPKTSTEVKRFMGMASWYRRFVKDFATIAAPIHNVVAGIAKGKPVVWTTEANEAFKILKRALTNSPVLVTPDFTKPFTIHCDASNTGVGAMLTQGVEEAPIAYASKKLGPEHKNYTTTEKECYAVLFGVEKFRAYVEGSKFTVVTDHSALKWLMKQQNLPDRLSRFVTKLVPYTFEIVHRKGKSNLVPDALSRMFENDDKQELSYVDLEANWIRVTSLSETVCTLDCSPLETDEWYNQMIKRFTGKSLTETYPFCIRRGHLYATIGSRPGHTHTLTYRKVVPESCRQAVMYDGHADPSAAHLGVKKTIARISERYYWPKMSRDIEKFVRSCIVCHMSKSKNGVKKQGLHGKYKFAEHPYQMISMDFVGPLTRSTLQNTVILVVTDWFTKFVSLFPMRDSKASKVVQRLENQIFLEYGVPEIVIMDNGKQFISKELMSLFDRYRVPKIWYNSYYHPQNNFTERYNRTLGNCLRAFSQEEQRHWDANIGKIQLALRTAVHSVTGYSPFYLNHGRQYIGSGNEYKELRDDVNVSPSKYASHLEKFAAIAEEVQERMKKAYKRNKKNYDRGRVNVTFEVGDLVMRRNFALSNASQFISAKLLPKYLPMYIMERTSDTTYDLIDGDGNFVGNYHVQDFYKPTSNEIFDN